jgi:hypothetical protein
MSDSVIASSELALKGSMFNRKVPVRGSGSCGIVVMRRRMVSRGTVDRSRESTLIVPEERLRIRAIVERRELFHCTHDIR